MRPLGQDVDERQNTRSNSSGAKPLPLVALENVSLGYASTPILQQINLEIYAGELVGLAGPNGSGKTTLFRAILGLLPIRDGTISHCPTSVMFLSQHRLTRSFL